jgi:hypothetical protein
MAYIEEVQLIIRSANTGRKKQHIALQPRDGEAGEFETDTWTAHLVCSAFASSLCTVNFRLL